MEDVFPILWINREMEPEIRNMDGLFKVVRHKALDFLKSAAKRADLQKMIARQLSGLQVEHADQTQLSGEY